MYRENATNELEQRMNRSVKLSNVGLRTRILGGKVNISSKGFREAETTYTSGSAIKIPNKSSTNPENKLPPKERVTRFCFSKRTQLSPFYHFFSLLFTHVFQQKANTALTEIHQQKQKSRHGTGISQFITDVAIIQNVRHDRLTDVF